MTRNDAVHIYSWAHHGTTTVRYEADDTTLLRLGLLPPERVPSSEVRCYRHADDRLVARLANGQVRLTLKVHELRTADAAFGTFMQRLLAPKRQAARQRPLVARK